MSSQVQWQITVANHGGKSRWQMICDRGSCDQGLHISRPLRIPTVKLALILISLLRTSPLGVEVATARAESDFIAGFNSIHFNIGYLLIG